MRRTRMRSNGGSRMRDQRGQAAVEFIVLTVALFFAMFLAVQLTWLAVQKWQFNHFASYAARVWSVRTDQSPGESLLMLVPGAVTSWDLLGTDYVKLMWVSSEDPVNDEDSGEDIPGLTYTGVAPLFPFYQPAIGDTFWGAFIPSDIVEFIPFELPSTGLVAFQTFVPMEKEPEEEPDRSDRDNDCDSTPCGGGNGR